MTATSLVVQENDWSILKNTNEKDETKGKEGSAVVREESNEEASKNVVSDNVTREENIHDRKRPPKETRSTAETINREETYERELEIHKLIDEEHSEDDSDKISGNVISQRIASIPYDARVISIESVSTQSLRIVESVPSDEKLVEEMKQQEERILGAGRRIKERRQKDTELERKEEVVKREAAAKLYEQPLNIEEVLCDIPLDEAKMDGHDVNGDKHPNFSIFRGNKASEQPFRGNIASEQPFKGTIAPEKPFKDNTAPEKTSHEKPRSSEEDLETEIQFAALKTCGSFFCF